MDLHALAIEYEHVCRLCLTPINNCTRNNEKLWDSLFSTNEDVLPYNEIIMEIINIQIDEHDYFPKKLCLECSSKLSTFYRFKKKCEDSERALHNVFFPNANEPRAVIKHEYDIDCANMCVAVVQQRGSCYADKYVEEQNKLEGVDNASPPEFAASDMDDTSSEQFKKRPTRDKKPIIKKTNGNLSPAELVASDVEDTSSEKDQKPRKKTKKFTIKKTNEIKAKKKPSIKHRKVCEECGLTFSTNCTLRRHRIIHTGRKDFCCDICNNRFARKFHLDMHMRIHLKIRPHVCETCNSSFSTSSDLTRHRRIHVDVKNYACVVCQRRFKRSSDVIKHMRTHTGQKPYSCKDCDKNYSSHSGLAKHLRRHHPKLTGERQDSSEKIAEHTEPVP